MKTNSAAPDFEDWWSRIDGWSPSSVKLREYISNYGVEYFYNFILLAILVNNGPREITSCFSSFTFLHCLRFSSLPVFFHYVTFSFLLYNLFFVCLLPVSWKFLNYLTFTLKMALFPKISSFVILISATSFYISIKLRNCASIFHQNDRIFFLLIVLASFGSGVECRMWFFDPSLFLKQF